MCVSSPFLVRFKSRQSFSFLTAVGSFPVRSGAKVKRKVIRMMSEVCRAFLSKPVPKLASSKKPPCIGSAIRMPPTCSRPAPICVTYKYYSGTRAAKPPSCTHGLPSPPSTGWSAPLINSICKGTGFQRGRPNLSAKILPWSARSCFHLLYCRSYAQFS